LNYLRNAWYVAASATEICRTPFRRVLLDEPVVFFRTLSNAPVALFDRCAHRLAPLSRGSLVGDTLQCGYHGLRFDSAGTCVHSPHPGPIPAAARVKSYPLVERHGFVWIWMGAAEGADPALVPDLDPFGRVDGYTTVAGYLRIAANYQLITDNLLDLSHVEFMHPAFAAEDVFETARAEPVRQGTTVLSNRWKPQCKVSRFLRMFWTSQSDRGDARANMRWHPPATLYLDVGVTEVGAPIGEGVTLPFAHLLTPETKTSTRYFWAMIRDCRIDDAALSEQVHRIVTSAFADEDEPMIEAQQREIGPDLDMMSLRPVLLQPDAAAMAARRVLAGLIDAERQATVVAAGSPDVDASVAAASE
jgi:phenylpropionate dioxygenase-like ring-hydroxylating dioxygenase large terminal subunit